MIICHNCIHCVPIAVIMEDGDDAIASDTEATSGEDGGNDDDDADDEFSFDEVGHLSYCLHVQNSENSISLTIKFLMYIGASKM